MEHKGDIVGGRRAWEAPLVDHWDDERLPMSLNDRDIERRMILAERADPRSRSSEADRPLQWPDLYVVDADHRRALKLWVWCAAHGCSFHGVCRERGLRYSTARRHRRAAVERIALLLAEAHVGQA